MPVKNQYIRPYRLLLQQLRFTGHFSYTFAMTGLEDIRHRLSTTYNFSQILKLITGIALLIGATWLFPDDFRQIRDNAVYLAILAGLLIIWISLFSIYIRTKLSSATSPASIAVLIRIESCGFAVSVCLLAILMPLSEPYYANLAWFFSAFLFCYALANPALESRLATGLVFSPVAGWIVHSAVHFVIGRRPIHIPALLFCLVISAILLYSRAYFVTRQTRSDMERDSLENMHPAAQSIKDLDAVYLYSKTYSLSPRESEVLRKIFHGRISKEIAAELGISVTTIKTHVRNIFDKTGVRSRLELMANFNRFNHSPLDGSLLITKEDGPQEENHP